MVAVGKLLDTYIHKRSTNIAKVSFDNGYLIEDEETMIAHVAKIITLMGMCINKETCLGIGFTIMSCRIASNDVDSFTVRLLDDMLHRNESLLKLG